MKIEKITPIVLGTLMIVLLALATSCSTSQYAQKTGVKKKFNGKLVSNVHHYNACPAYH
tara:strand:- start:248 stop:424 length:177 start_codon:yes stop_codon:yes gene_type:complete